MTIRSIVAPLFLGLILANSPISALGRSEGSIQKTWDYPEGIRTLVLDADGQDVVLKAGGPRLSGRLLGDSSDSVKIVREGDTLTISVRSDRNWFSWRNKTSRIEMTLPPGLSLDLNTASGAVLIEVPTESLRVRSASGDVEAARGGTTADVDTASGTVRLKGFHGSVAASTLSGNLVLEDLSGGIQAAALSGNLLGTGIKPTAGSRFSVVSGNATLTLVGGPEAYAIHAETVSGEISIGTITGKDSLISGTGPALLVKAVSGNIHIR